MPWSLPIWNIFENIADIGVEFAALLSMLTAKIAIVSFMSEAKKGEGKLRGIGGRVRRARRKREARLPSSARSRFALFPRVSRSNSPSPPLSTPITWLLYLSRVSSRKRVTTQANTTTNFHININFKGITLNFLCLSIPKKNWTSVMKSRPNGKICSCYSRSQIRIWDIKRGIFTNSPLFFWFYNFSDKKRAGIGIIICSNIYQTAVVTCIFCVPIFSLFYRNEILGIRSVLQ